MKIGKWYIISELDKFVYKRKVTGELKERIKFYEKINYEQYNEIERLRKENEYLKKHQKIKIVNLEVK